MTNLLLLIGAGLFTRSVSGFQNYAFNKLLGADATDAGAAGNGPGSYDVRGNVWHLDCCNPGSKLDAGGWSIFRAILGWTNNATGKQPTLLFRGVNYADVVTVGSVLAYIFYWLAVIVVLISMKFKEVCPFFLGCSCALRFSHPGPHETPRARVRGRGTPPN
jgi:high-affinity iron transporter